MLRERVAVVYPGTRKVGVSLWVIENRRVARVAVGAPEASAVTGILQQFGPDTLVVDPYRVDAPDITKFRAEAQDLEVPHPDWYRKPLMSRVGPVGRLAHNAYRMGYHHLIRRGPYRVGGPIGFARLTPEWLTENSPSRRRHAARAD